MHGVPADLDLEMFVGARLIQVCLGGWDLQFHFQQQLEGDAHNRMRDLSVEGKWEFRSSDGDLIDEGDLRDGPSRTAPLQFQQVISQTVSGWSIHAPDWIELELSNGVTIRVYDDPDGYESFSIQPGNIFI